MANVLVRSPYYVTSQQGLAQNGTATIEITVGGTLRYTITKDSDNTGRVYFEIAELMRDYLDIVLAQDNGGFGYVTHSKSYSLSTQHYNSSGSAVGSPITVSGFIMDGYGYFQDGYNPTTTRGYMQSNDVIYRLDDSAIQIPVDLNNTSRVTFMYRGDVMKTQNIGTGTSYCIEYVTNEDSDYDSFKDRVDISNGTYEDNACIKSFLGEFDISDVDQVLIDTTDGIKNIQVITLSECRYQPIKVIFFNRWGAEQDVWFFRKSVESLTSNRESFKRAVISTTGSLAGSYDVLQHSKTNFNVQSQKSITINTGYVDESYNTIMEEILQSELVWIEIDNVTSPVIVKDNSLTYKTSVNDKLVDYSLSLDFANDHIQNIR